MSYQASVRKGDASPIERAKVQIIMHHPFYASILLKRELSETEAIPTAAVDARGQIYYNNEWFNTLTIDEIVFVLCHECMHYMWLHAMRMYGRDPKLWNKACDAVINETLKLCNVGKMPAEGIERAGAEDMSSEQVYDLMWEDKPPDGEGEGDGKPEEGWGIGNDIDTTIVLDEATVAEIESEIKVEISQAANAAKQMGKMPAALERFVEALLEVKTPWYEKLYAFFTNRIEDDYSWTVFDRRFVSRGIRLPWFDGVGMGKAVIIVDVSGSISDTELTEFSGHINTVLDTCNPEELYVIFVHSRVVEDDIRLYTPDDYPVDLKCSESGGTDMRRGIDWVTENHADSECIIVLTDGYTPWGEDCHIPTFWAMTTDIVAPWGETVKIDMDY